MYLSLRHLLLVSDQTKRKEVHTELDLATDFTETTDKIVQKIRLIRGWSSARNGTECRMVSAPLKHAAPAVAA